MDIYQGWVNNLAIESSSQKPPWNEVHIYMHNTIFIFAALTDVVGSDQASSEHTQPPSQRVSKVSHLRWPGKRRVEAI